MPAGSKAFFSCRQAQPAQAAIPFKKLRAPEFERRRSRWHRQAPQRLGAAKEAVRLLANRAPEGSVIGEFVATYACRGGLDRRRRAGKTHIERAVVPGARRDGERLAGPAIHSLQG